MKKILFIVFITNIWFVNAQYTAIPDSGFEQNLIDLGIDSEGILDGQVLTSDISSLTNLHLTYEIYSLEGIEGFLNLEELDLSESLIYYMDVTQNTSLRVLNCSTNMLYELDLSNNVNLEVLNCSWGFISALDVTNSPNLEYISCQGNNISNLDLSNKLNLEWLGCSLNPLTILDISNTPSLTYLFTGATELTTLDVSGNSLLEYLDCGLNNLNALNLDNNQNLVSLKCSNNYITELILDNNSLIEILHCVNNNLYTLSIQNGANELLTGTFMSGSNEVQRYNSLNNPNLTCIFVDDAQYCSDNWIDYDTTSNFVETQTECDALGLSDYEFNENIRIFPNPVDDYIRFSHNQAIDQVKIHSSTGALIKSFNKQDKYNMSELADGIYILRIYSNERIIQRKLIKR